MSVLRLTIVRRVLWIGLCPNQIQEKNLPMCRKSKLLRQHFMHENRKFEFFGGTISPSSVLIDCDLIDSDIDFREASVGFL